MRGRDRHSLSLSLVLIMMHTHTLAFPAPRCSLLYALPVSKLPSLQPPPLNHPSLPSGRGQGQGLKGCLAGVGGQGLVAGRGEVGAEVG